MSENEQPTLTGRTIKLPKGVINTSSHEVLQGLFEQVMEQLSEEDAFRLCAAYVAGKVIDLEIALNSRGKEYRTAMRLSIGEDWRLPDPQTKGSA